MARKALVLSVIAAAIVALLLAAVVLREGSVSAQPIAGATYTGTVSVGGTVSLSVSADGTEVTQFSYDILAEFDGICFASAELSGLAVPIENDTFTYEQPYFLGVSISGSFPSAGTAEGTIVTELSPPCDSVTWTATTAVPSPTPSPTPTPTPTPGQMHNCPEAGKWSIATWSGQDAMPISDALAFCPQQVDVAYRIDPDTQAWSRYFRGRPEISNLDTLDYGQGVIALGGGVSAAATASDEAVRATANGMLGCPLQGKWAIAVWDGDEGTDAEEALATCGEDAVAVAYSIDPQTQAWSRWFDGRPEISNLDPLSYMQGVLALGGTGAPATSTPTPTPTPTGGPPTAYLDTFHAALDMSMGSPLAEMSAISESDFEAPDRCSCDVTLTTGGGAFEFQFEDHIVVIGDKAWIDEGDGWSETTPSDVPVRLFDMCPACPSFWEEYSLEPPQLPGEHETKNGVPAIHYSVAELCEDFVGLGIWTPEELEGASIEACDIWLAEDDYWPVRLYMEMSQVAHEVYEWSSTAITVDITRVNDPGIEVNAP